MKPTAIRTLTEIDALRTAVVLTMERLCFASPQRFTDEPPAEDTVDACVAFRGAVSGAVGIAIPRHALLDFAAAVVPPEALAHGLPFTDLVLEIANIVCGNVVPRIFGRTSVYVLSAPQLGQSTAAVIASAVIHFDRGWVTATLHKPG